jgi:hypothetical protein
LHVQEAVRAARISMGYPVPPSPPYRFANTADIDGQPHEYEHQQLDLSEQVPNEQAEFQQNDQQQQQLGGSEHVTVHYPYTGRGIHRSLDLVVPVRDTEPNVVLPNVTKGVDTKGDSLAVAYRQLRLLEYKQVKAI